MAWTELTAEKVLLNQKKHKNSLRKHRKRAVSKYRTKKGDKATRAKNKSRKAFKKEYYITQQGNKTLATHPDHQASECKVFTPEEIKEMYG